MDQRDAVRELVDKLPESELAAAKRYLEYLRDMGDPMMRMLKNAPVDDEPTTPEEDSSCKEAVEEYRRGEYLAQEEAERELFK